VSRPPGLRKFVGPPGAATPAAAPAQGRPDPPAPPERQAMPEGQATRDSQATPDSQAAQVEERCEFCATGIPATHGHVADLEKSSLACACRACYLLFTQAAPGRGDDLPQAPAASASAAPQGAPRQGAAPRRGPARYRSVPDRYQRDSSRPMSAAEWDELQIPVGLAFFLYSSERGAVAGFYPSPAGATECTLDLAAWERLAAAHPLSVVAFGAPGPGAGAGSPLRSVEFAWSSEAPGAGRPGSMRAIMAFLNAQGAPFRPAQAAVIRLPDGRAVVRAEFTAPSPLGLLGPGRHTGS